MKKTFIYIAVLCTVMFAGVSCEKIEEPVQVKDDSQEVIESELPEGGDYVVKFSLSMADDQTKTGFDSGTGIEWKKGDEVVFYQRFFKNDADAQMVRQPYTYTVTGDTKEIDANASFYTPYKNEVHYVAFYPKSNMPGGFLTLANKLMGQISLPENQIPSRNSYDPKADILISKYLVTTPLGKPTSFKLQFERMNAIGKMTIKNLQSASDISSLTFTAKKQSGEKVVLAGSTYYKFDNAIGYARYDYSNSSTSSYNTSEQTAITLDYSSIESFSLSGDSGGTAYFCCYPFELGAGDSFTVKIITKAGEVFEKVVTLTAEMVANFKDDKFIFARGQATKFTIDMSSAEQDEATVTIGGTTKSHSTITDAFDYANEATGAATIKLMKDCTADAPLTVNNANENANITLDLNGYTLTELYEKIEEQQSSNRISVSQGKLNIISSEKEGFIVNETLAYLIDVQGGQVSIDDENVTISELRESSDSYLFKVGPNGTLKISAGKYNVAGGKGLISGDSGQVSISGGYFSKEVESGYLADNYNCYQTKEYEDYPYSVLPTGVALFRQGTGKVESKTAINNAIDAANSATGKECTITLVDNCQVSGTSAVNVTNSAGVTLDLNGKTLTQNTTSRLGVSESGYLKIIDLKQDGKITQTATGYNTFSISSGTLEIAGGSIEQAASATKGNMIVSGTANLIISEKAVITSVGSSAVSVSESGKLTVNDGTITSNGSGNAISFSSSGDLTINDGTITSNGSGNAISFSGSGNLTVESGNLISKGNSETIIAAISVTGNNSGKLNMNGGSISVPEGSGYGLYVNNPNCTVEIKEGKISSSASYAFEMRSGTATVSGGTIESSEGHTILINNPDNSTDLLNLTVKGGNIVATANLKYSVYVKNLVEGSKLTINGGDFRSNYRCMFSATQFGTIEISPTSDVTDGPYFYSYDSNGTSENKVRLFSRNTDCVKPEFSCGYFGCASEIEVWELYQYKIADGYSLRRYTNNPKVHDNLNYWRLVETK